jgi:signal transduction histidine kinase
VFAHEVRTSLTGVLALGELLARSDLGARERQWAADIKTSAEHLAALTTLVVDAAKAGAHSLILQEEKFRPRDLLKALGATLAARAEAKGLTASVQIAVDLPEYLIGDPVRLRAALESLLDNAVKFTERGTVEWEARANAYGSISLCATAASVLRQRKSSDCSDRSSRQAPMSPAAMAAQALA